MAKDKSKKQDAVPVEESKAKKKKDKSGDAGAFKQVSGGLVGASSGGQFSNKESVGKLLIVWPKGLREGMTTSAGVSDAVEADVAILDEKKPEKSELIEDALIFGKVLVGQLKGQPLLKGNAVLGRLILDDASKKPGQNAPYRLASPTGDDLKVGEAYMATLSPVVGA